jgi:hypothetical protein
MEIRAKAGSAFELFPTRLSLRIKAHHVVSSQWAPRHSFISMMQLGNVQLPRVRIGRRDEACNSAQLACHRRSVEESDSKRFGALSAVGQTISWMVIFFFASTAASSAYLTVSDCLPD